MLRCTYEHKITASKFSLGNHSLKIENGRFTIPETPANLRICDHCNLNSVEDEMQVLFHCELYDQLRKISLLKSLNKIGYLKALIALINDHFFLIILILA